MNLNINFDHVVEISKKLLFYKVSAIS